MINPPFKLGLPEQKPHRADDYMSNRRNKQERVELHLKHRYCVSLNSLKVVLSCCYVSALRFLPFLPLGQLAGK